MPNLPIVSFNTGEVTPLIDARSDVSKYSSACRILENMLPRIYGGVERRPGTKFIAVTKNPNLASRLIPFIYSNTIAYMTEFGDLYVRFYFDGGKLLDGSGNHVDVTTPYVAADLFELQYKQSNDVMWIVHQTYQPRKLTRTTATSFSLDTITFSGGPFLARNDLDTEDGRTLTPSVTTGTGTLTASADTFESGHIGSLWKLTQPRVNVSVTGSKTAPATGVIGSALDVLGSFTFNLFSAAVWTGTVILQRNEDGTNWETFRTYTSNATRREVQLSAQEESSNVQYRINVTALSAGTVNCELTVNNSTQDGIVRVDSFASATSVGITVISDLASTDATVRWAEGAWSGVRGYPRTVTFFEERAVYASTTHQPQTIWLSKSGQFECFKEGTNDNDSFSLTLSSDTRNAIQWIGALEALLLGTTGGEWRLRSNSRDEPLTPNNYSIKQQTTYGSKAIQALPVNDVLMFVDFVGRKARELTSPEGDKYVAPDLTALAEHITETGITSIAYQKNPDSILWCIRADGTLISMTYEREQDVVAWARHFTGDNLATASTRTITTDVDISSYVDSYIAQNTGMAIIDGDFNVTTVAAGIAGSTTIDINQENGEIAMGTGTAIYRRQSDGTEDTDYYVPDGGWPPAIDLVRAVRYTYNSDFLYAVINVTGGNETLYKFEVATGDEVWNLVVGWNPFGVGIDSSDNVYVPGKAALTEPGIQKVNADGTLGTHYDSVFKLNLVRDVWVDESQNMILHSGTSLTPLPITTTKIAAYQLDTGGFLWQKTLTDLGESGQIWAVRTRMGRDNFIYCCGSNMDLEEDGNDASVWKLDLAGNVVASYDPGENTSHCWFLSDDRLVVKSEVGGNDKLYVLDTDLQLLETHDFVTSGLFGAEGINLPTGLLGAVTTTTTITSLGEGYESVAVIPAADEDEVWVTATRSINGEIRRYVEQMQPRDFGDQEDAWFVDSGLDYDSTPADEFSGLDHLEGEEVVILGDGAVFARETVTDGTVTLDDEVSRAIIGLPFRYKLKPMRFDLTAQSGTTKGSIKKITEIVISFFRTLLAKYGKDTDNLLEIDWRTTEAYTEPPELYTGDKVVRADGGFDPEDSIIITDDGPFPCTVRAMVLRTEITGR